MIRVIVCAAPHFTNQRTVDDALDAVLHKHGPFVLVGKLPAGDVVPGPWRSQYGEK